MTKDTSNTTKVLKGMSSQTIVTITLGVVEIVSFSIMSRLLGQRDFGYYAAIVAIGAVFQSLADAGIGSAVVQRKELNDRFVNNAFTLSLLFGVGVAVVMCALSKVLATGVADASMTTPLRIFSVTLICHCIASVNTSLLQREMRFMTIGVINLISLVVTTAVAIVLALQGYGYYAILTKAVLASFLTMIMSWIASKRVYRLAFDRDEYGRIFGFGGWLMASAVFRNLSHQVDRLLMKSLFSIETLGMYTRPHEFITNITGKVNQIYDSVLFPVLSSIQDSRERIRFSFSQTLYLLNVGAMLLSLAFLFCHNLIIRVFFGEQWLNVATLFAVMSAWSVIRINGRLGDVYLRSLAMTRTQFILRVCQFASVTVFILIGYRWGLTALAISSMTGYSIVMLAKNAIIAKRIGLPIKEMLANMLSAWRPLIWLAPIYAACSIALPETLAGSILSTVVFAIAATVTYLLFPGLVGQRYKDEYAKIRLVIASKINNMRGK